MAKSSIGAGVTLSEHQNIVSLRLEQVPCEAAELLPSVEVERKLRIGRLLRDNSPGQRFSHPRYTDTYSIKFSPIYARIIDDVAVHWEMVPIWKGKFVVDHLTVAIHSSLAELRAAPTIIRYLERLSDLDDSVDADEIEEPTLVVHNEGGGTWGHWIVQNLPKVLLFLEHFSGGKVALPAFHESSNFARCLDVFGIPATSLVALRRDRALRLRRAVFVDPIYNRGAHPWALDRLRRVAPISRSDHSKSVFVHRPAGAGRSLANETELRTIARHYGFSDRTLGNEHLAAQIEVWQSANRLIAVLGSDLTNMVFAPNACDLSVFVLSPDTHGDLFFADLAAAQGVTWNEVMSGNVVERTDPLRHSTFSVSQSVFQALLS